MVSDRYYDYLMNKCSVFSSFEYMLCVFNLNRFHLVIKHKLQFRLMQMQDIFCG
jgi:hypothetical protein